MRILALTRPIALMCAATIYCSPSEGSSPVMAQEAQAEIVRRGQALFATFPAQPSDVEQLYGISQRQLAIQPFDSPARQDWSYWPRKRGGVALWQLDDNQRRLLHALLSEVFSQRGYLQVVQTQEFDDILRSLDANGFLRSSDNYYLTFFGEPSLHEPWALRFEGHHLAVNLTLTGSGHFSATPFFVGVAPAEIQRGPLTGFRPLGQQEDLALRLVKSLTPSQAAVGVGPHAPAEFLTSPYQKNPSRWEDWKRDVKDEGIDWRALKHEQQDIAAKLLTTVLAVYRPEISDPYLHLTERRKMHFLWLGAAELGKPHYFRLTAGDFIFEFDNFQDNANHIHTVWRDRSNDLGQAALKEDRGSEVELTRQAAPKMRPQAPSRTTTIAAPVRRRS
jgi:hypothetical protein